MIGNHPEVVELQPLISETQPVHLYSMYWWCCLFIGKSPTKIIESPEYICKGWRSQKAALLQALSRYTCSSTL